MMKYGAEPQEHRFTLSLLEKETRGQWLDIFLGIHPEAGQALPEELQDPSVLVICNQVGDIIQIVLLDEGCDCEYQFTGMEKDQIERFVQPLLA
ncbi:hypothetical protein [Paenibacillus aestuarii]|uniref:Uncharacterized protein n=1 Tax=Paenibacillus aestuarii TaxID=516965 RepID=A0ABW0KKA4_9BACL|nr:hypothetical protein [Paenibacillus aestuarii]